MKRILKDYVVYVDSIVDFRAYLVASDSTYVSDEKLNITKTLARNATGSTVSFVRIDANEWSFFEGCTACRILGEAKESFIKSLEDIAFYTLTDKYLYYTVHDKTQVTYQDEDGKDYTSAPPLIHGIMASKPINYI